MTERSIRPTIFHESAGAVVLDDGRCLVIRRGDTGQWVLPKGHFHQGERAEDAAVREVLEATGLALAADGAAVAPDVPSAPSEPAG